MFCELRTTLRIFSFGDDDMCISGIYCGNSIGLEGAHDSAET